MASVSDVVKEVFRDPLSTSEVSGGTVTPPAPTVREPKTRPAPTVGKAVTPPAPTVGGAETRPAPPVGGTVTPPAPTVAGAGNVIIPRFFKLIFLTIFFITIAVLIGQGYIVIRFGDEMGDTRQALVSYLQTIGTAGVGAIFGLVGGKVS